MTEFFQAPGQTGLSPDEMLEAIVVEKPSHLSGTAYIKLGVREALEMSLVDVAVLLTLDAADGCIIAARVVMGSVAPYRLPHMKYDGYRIYTNRAAWEHQIDFIAEELGMDPVELRFKNSTEAGDITCNEFNTSSYGMKECIEAVKDGSKWNGKKGKMPEGKGIGVACGFFLSGGGYPIYRSETAHSTVVIKLSEDGGTAHVLTGSAEIGHGSDTTMAMIAAEALGVPLDHIKVSSGDMDSRVDLGAYSSRQALMTGHTTKRAAEDLRRQVLEVLGDKLKISPDRMDIKKGYIVFTDETPDISLLRTTYVKEHRGFTDKPDSDDPLTFREAARMAYLTRGSMVGTGSYKPAELDGKFKAAAVGTSPAYGPPVQVAEVTVGKGTGKVTVDHMTDAHDCGFAINRTSVEGPMPGSLSMGLGEAMFEEVKFDRKGRILNANLEYKIPTALDMPSVDTIIVESNEPNGPFGAKEVGEGAIMPTIPATLNAVYAAVGVKIHELPLTPERVLTALQERQKEKKDKP